jgi:hypothetical protein
MHGKPDVSGREVKGRILGRMGTSGIALGIV